MQNNDILLYQTQAIRKLEQLAIEQYGIPAAELMQRAGTAAFRELKKHWSRANKIAVICGKGNNGGDGYVIAKLVQAAGLQVTILTAHPIEELQGIAKDAANACQNANIQITEFAKEKLQQYHVIVDALLGIGATGEVSEKYKTIIHAINASKIPVFAIDAPSGLNAETGCILGAAVRATVTITFIAPKPGLFTGDAREYCGKIICDRLNLPQEIFTKVNAAAYILSLEKLKALLPKRSVIAHKGDFGHVLLIGGDFGMGGAIRMSAEAAARTGAGLVSVATREEHICAINAARPEIMCHGIRKAAELEPLIAKASVIVIGPGLGTSKWGKQLWQKVITCKKPLIIDADALNLLAKKIYKKDNWILTPHPGEAAKLLKSTNKEIQRDRFTALNKIIGKYNGICLLKGAGTLIGKQGSAQIGICNYGNPGMASGGMGDILSGVIGALVAQHLDLLAATELGSCIHAAAGDCAAKDAGERGLLATDLLFYIRKLIN